VSIAKMVAGKPTLKTLKLTTAWFRRKKLIRTKELNPAFMF